MSNFQVKNNSQKIAQVLNDNLGKTGKLRTISGHFTPTAAGNYAVIDDSTGATIQLPGNSYVQQISLAPKTTLVGGTDVDVGGAATNGGAVVTSLTGGVLLLAVVNAGQTVASDVILGTTNFWISATTTGINTAGEVKVFLTVLDI